MLVGTFPRTGALTGTQFSITLLPELNCFCKRRGKAHAEVEAALEEGLVR